MTRDFPAAQRKLNTFEDIVDPQHTALLVIDVQNDFVGDGGYMAVRHRLDMTPFQAAVPRINDLIAGARSHGVRVVYVREIISKNTVMPNFLTQMGDYDQLPVREGTWGAEFYPDLLPPAAGEPVISKPDYDGFEDTNLDATLRSLGILSCVFTGFASNICVETTARHAYVKGYHAVLVSDAAAAGSAGEHEACLNLFATFFGPVRTSAEILAAWRQRQEPRRVP